MILDVYRFDAMLKSISADFEIMNHDRPIYTINDAKAYFDINLAVPNLIINTDKGFFSLLISGSRGRADFEMLKTVLQCHSVSMAIKKEVLEQTGYESGKVPLLGLSLPYIFDNQLLQYRYVYGGIGDAYKTLKINPHDLKKATMPVAYLEEY